MGLTRARASSSPCWCQQHSFRVTGLVFLRQHERTQRPSRKAQACGGWAGSTCWCFLLAWLQVCRSHSLVHLCKDLFIRSDLQGADLAHVLQHIIACRQVCLAAALPTCHGQPGNDGPQALCRRRASRSDTAHTPLASRHLVTLVTRAAAAAVAQCWGCVSGCRPTATMLLAEGCQHGGVHRQSKRCLPADLSCRLCRCPHLPVPRESWCDR